MPTAEEFSEAQEIVGLVQQASQKVTPLRPEMAKC